MFVVHASRHSVIHSVTTKHNFKNPAFIWCDSKWCSHAPDCGPGRYWKSCRDTSRTWKVPWRTVRSWGGTCRGSTPRSGGAVRTPGRTSGTADAAASPAAPLHSSCRRKPGSRGSRTGLCSPPPALQRPTSSRWLKKDSGHQNTSTAASVPDYMKPNEGKHLVYRKTCDEALIF